MVNVRQMGGLTYSLASVLYWGSAFHTLLNKRFTKGPNIAEILKNQPEERLEESLFIYFKFGRRNIEKMDL